MKPSNHEATLDDVLLQLTVTNRLLIALIKSKEAVSTHDLTVQLGDANVPNQVIADLLGSTPDAVRVMIDRERKKSKPKEKIPDGGK